MSRVNARKRGKKWQYYYDTAKIDGKRQTKYGSGLYTTQREALAAGQADLEQYNNGGYALVDQDISLADFAKIFINDIKTRRTLATVTSYQAALNACIVKELGAYKLVNINRYMVNQLVNKLKIEGYAKRTMTFYICVGRKLFDCARDHKILFDNPFANVEAPDNSLVNEGRPHTAYTDSYVKELMEAYKGDQLKPVIMLGYYAGLRISEMCALTWDDIDFNTRVITVNKQMSHDEKAKKFYFDTPKYNSSRYVEMPPELTEYLKQYKQAQTKSKRYQLNRDSSITEGNDFSFIITNWHGNLVCKRYVITRIRNLKKKNYPGFTVHSLRHTHCTKLIDSGVKEQYVQKRLGHKSLKTTLDTYTHLTENRRKTEADKLDYIFKN